MNDLGRSSIVVDRNYVEYFDSPYSYKLFIENNRAINIISVFASRNAIVLTYSKKERVTL